MLKYSKGKKISLNLTLVNNDGKPEENADIKYEIYDYGNTLVYFNNSVPFNPQLGSYIDVIDPATQWTSQEEGVYHVKWYISNTVEEYPQTVVEPLYIDTYDNKLDKILGLVHENVFIDEPEYDEYGNLIGAKVTLYSNSASVGTYEDVIATYKIEAEAESQGKLVYWKQVEE